MENRNPSIVVLGSCSVDFTTYAPRLPLAGETLHGYKFATSNGGKGANQCVAASKLGGKTAMIARVGNDTWGEGYIKSLKENGVDTTHLYLTDNENTGIAQINVSKSGENQIVIVAGANNLLSADDVRSAKDYIENAAVLACQLETPIEATEKAFELCKGIKILNAAPAVPNLSKKLLSLTTILCVNESEASIITGKDVNCLGDVPVAIDCLLKMGCEIVIITLGGNGASFASKADPTPMHISCQKVTPIDTTGAGDAFTGALATLLAMDSKILLAKAIGAACRVASISVTIEGTQTSYPKISCDSLLNHDYTASIIDCCRD